MERLDRRPLLGALATTWLNRPLWLHHRAGSRVPLLLALAALSCQTPQPSTSQPSTSLHRVGEVVNLRGLELSVANVERVPEIRGTMQRLRSDTGFLVITTQVRNLRPQPLDGPFRPLVTLFNGSGIEFSHSATATTALSMGNLTAMSRDLEPLNPGAVRRRRIVYEVPPGDYVVRIIVPDRAQAGFMMQSVNVSGPYVCFDLSTVAAPSGDRSESRPASAPTDATRPADQR